MKKGNSPVDNSYPIEWEASPHVKKRLTPDFKSRWAYMDFYSKEQNLLYYHILKNASTAIRKTPLVNFKWTPVKLIPKTARVFCVLRDPFTRAVSSYIQLRGMSYRQLRSKNNKKFFSKSKANLKKMFFHSSDEKGVKNYLDEIYHNGFFNGHHTPQIYWINFKERMRNMNKIDYFLNLSNLKNELSEVFGYEITPIKKNIAKKTMKNRWTKAMSKFKDEICDIYSEDVKLYKEKIS